MAGFYDAHCTCGQRIGWAGTYADRPACPRCGYRPSSEEAKTDQEVIARVMRELAGNADGRRLRRLRMRAALSMGQLARAFGVGVATVSDVERGRADVATIGPPGDVFATASPCTHRLAVDELEPEWIDSLGRPTVFRRCLTCGRNYDRKTLLARLERAIRDLYRLPSTPWTSEERSEEA